MKKSINKYKSIVGLLGLAMLLSCENDVKEIKELTFQEDLPELVGVDIEYTFTDSTRLMYKIKAKEFIQKKIDIPIYELSQGGKLVSYNKQGQQIWQMKAGYAKSTNKGTLWEFRNDVEAISNEGKTINTELMYWNQKTGKLHSDKYVRIAYKDGQILEGVDFSSDEKFHKIRLRKITGSAYIKK